jgi:hypothetical protein
MAEHGAAPLPTTAAFAAGLAGGVVLGRTVGREQARFARLAGWSIATPAAAAWVTDFLNAAYYRWPQDVRELDDLRLAFAIITTYWYRCGGRRLRGTDVLAFRRGFERARFDTSRSPRGMLDHDQLLDGAVRMFGPWFAEARSDPDRTGWGIVFATAEAVARYRPERRLELAEVGPMTPPTYPPEQQTWHTYRPVPMPSVDGVLALLSRPERWPDFGTEIGRFTALRSRGLPGQTFEIEVAAGTSRGRPVFQRGYVTVTRAVGPDDGADAVREYADSVDEGLVRYGEDEPPAVPDGAEPVFAIELTTHEGHFMGHARNRLILFTQDGEAYLRAVGTWDPMPWHAFTAYELAGRDAQHAFWGEWHDPRRSMLLQIAAQAS